MGCKSQNISLNTCPPLSPQRNVLILFFPTQNEQKSRNGCEKKYILESFSSLQAFLLSNSSFGTKILIIVQEAR
jgi:hypothetical protein